MSLRRPTVSKHANLLVRGLKQTAGENGARLVFSAIVVETNEPHSLCRHSLFERGRPSPGVDSLVKSSEVGTPSCRLALRICASYLPSFIGITIAFCGTASAYATARCTWLGLGLG